MKSIEASNTLAIIEQKNVENLATEMLRSLHFQDFLDFMIVKFWHQN